MSLGSVLGGVTIIVVNADREDGAGANVHAVKSQVALKEVD